MSILVENLNHIYDIGSPYETAALSQVTLQIEAGEFIGLIGHTGSGKSTLIQHLNGLLKPTSGKITVNGLDLTAKSTKLSEIRKKVGLVFQYPEYQLFEETVEKDVAFGPTNLGLSEEDIAQRVKEAIGLVGLNYDEIKDKSPFELSGGQKRRVAIAGVLSMNPEVLILDEPTAGLDPRGRDEILGQIKSLHHEKNITVILVSHSMEDVARMANRLIVMDKGQIALEGPPSQVFRHDDKLEAIGLGVPQITKLTRALRDSGYSIPNGIVTVEEARTVLLELIKGKNNA
jgi:energy-coupling factor transport system ATP-binding protein